MRGQLGIPLHLPSEHWQMIIRDPEEIKAVAKSMTDAYTAGYQDKFDGKPEAKMPSYQEQEAYRMGRSRCEAEMQAEHARIG